MTRMRTLSADLLSDITGTYDQTKTTKAGTAALRTLAGESVLSPPPVTWFDFFTDFAETVTQVEYTPNGRVFGITAVTAGLARVCAYTLDATTGAYAPIGKIQITVPNLAATTHTSRGFKVDDSSTSDIKVFFGTTGTVAINGGLFMTNLLPLTDFTMILSVTLTMAIGSNTKGVYFLQDVSNIGAGQLNIATAAVSLDRVNKLVYVHNGIAATHQYYLYDYNLTPNNPSFSCTTPIASPGVVVSAGHPYAVGDQVQFAVSGGALPTGLVAGTTYFVIAAGFSAGVSFQVALTTGGGAINFTGTSTGTQTTSRAFGITGALWKWKTGNLPALTGTLILLNSEVMATPGYGAGVSGQPCIFFATTSNLYLGKLSELTSGAVTWPNLITSNLLGTANQIIAPVLVQAAYDEVADRAVFTTSVTKMIAKKVVNNVIEDIFGTLNDDYLEGVTTVGSTTLIEMGGLTVGDIRIRNGWILLCTTAIGQRGVIAKNSGADFRLDATYAISKVLDFGKLSLLVGVTNAAIKAEESSNSIAYYRTSGFGTAAGGWTQLPASLLFPAATYASQIQLKIAYSVNDHLHANPTFLKETSVSFKPITDNSNNWALDQENSTRSSESPAKSAAILEVAYATVVPSITMTAISRATSSVVLQKNTVTHAGEFSYSSNSGTSWNALGTIPNVINTTRLRYNWSTPIPEDVDIVWSET